MAMYGVVRPEGFDVESARHVSTEEWVAIK